MKHDNKCKLAMVIGRLEALQNEIGVVIEMAVEEGLNVLETKLRKNDQEEKT